MSTVFTAILITRLALCATPAIDSPETHRVEAEALASAYGFQSLQGVRPITYSHASNKLSLYLHGQKLSWTVNVRRGGTYWLWMRARSGWKQAHFFADGKYGVTVAGRAIQVTALRQTLDYYADGENFVWLRSEPVNLDAGEATWSVSCKWEWAHVDCLVLTADERFTPPKGNIATAMATVGSKIDAWRVDPYLAFNPRLEPPKECPKPEIKLLCPCNATAYAAFAVRNRPDSPWPAHLVIRGPKMKAGNGAVLSEEWVRIHRLAVTGVRTGLLAPDALPELNRLGYAEVAPGCTACFWVMLRIPQGAEPGRYRGTLAVQNQASLKSVTVPIELEIVELVLPERTDLAVFSWWGYGSAAQAWWDDQLAHGTNVFKFIVYNHVAFRFDEQGELQGEMDFSRLAKVVDAYRRTGGYVLPEWYLHAKQFATLQCRVPGVPSGPVLAFMSPPWQRAFETLLTRINGYLESEGVPRDRIPHYIFDEYLGERFVQVAKLIRGLDPSYRVFSDLSADLATYQRVAPYLDIWCAFFGDLGRMAKDGRLEFMRSTGKPIWFYDPGHNQRAEPAYAKYRHKFWRAFRHQLDGCTYWKHAGDGVGTAYYATRGSTPVTSRRYEAWYSGLQDYKLLKMLKRLSQSGSGEATAAAELLDKAVPEVAAAPTRPELAAQYRTAAIRILCAAKQP